MGDKIQTLLACISPVFPISLKIADANPQVIFISGIGSVVLIVFKIIESNSKRKYYDEKRQRETEDFKNQKQC